MTTQRPTSARSPRSPRRTLSGFLWRGPSPLKLHREPSKRRRSCTTESSTASSPWTSCSPSTPAPAKPKWRWDPDVPREHISGLCCGPVNRGMAIYNGRVFAGLLDGRVVALDQENGQGHLVHAGHRPRRRHDPHLRGPRGQRQGYCRIQRRRTGRPGILHGLRRRDGKTYVRFYNRSRRSVETLRASRARNGREDWTGEWYKWGGGTVTMRWRRIPPQIFSISEQVTAAHGTRTFAARRAATFSSSPRFSRSNPTPDGWSGISRRCPAKPGTSPRRSPSSSRI